MLNPLDSTIRPLERSDVPAMLAIIRDAREEYGLASPCRIAAGSGGPGAL